MSPIQEYLHHNTDTGSESGNLDRRIDHLAEAPQGGFGDDGEFNEDELLSPLPEKRRSNFFTSIYDSLKHIDETATDDERAFLDQLHDEVNNFNALNEHLKREKKYYKGCRNYLLAVKFGPGALYLLSELLSGQASPESLKNFTFITAAMYTLLHGADLTGYTLTVGTGEAQRKIRIFNHYDEAKADFDQARIKLDEQSIRVMESAKLLNLQNAFEFRSGDSIVKIVNACSAFFREKEIGEEIQRKAEERLQKRKNDESTGESEIDEAGLSGHDDSFDDFLAMGSEM